MLYTIEDVATLAKSVSRYGANVVSYVLYNLPLSAVKVVIQCNDASGTGYQLSTEITENGDVYNSTFSGYLLVLLVEWARRLRYKDELLRQRVRTNLFKDELITTVMGDAYHIKDSFVPVQ